AIFSLEMTAEQLNNRLVSATAGVPMKAFRNPEISGRDQRRIFDAIKYLYDMPIYIDDTSDVTAIEVKAKCRRLASEQKLSLIVIDYLQLMRGVGRTENRTQEIAEIARSLKNMAKDLRVPVIALAQVSRAAEARENKRPTLSDLRESGSIEAEADLVLAIFRDAYYKRQAAGGDAPFDPEAAEIAEVGVLKHRNGPTGIIRLAFEPFYTRFSNPTPEAEAQYLDQMKRGRAGAGDD
ncbi:MAG: DnaB-like helicase C-terminal domain-containing protein, partial [Fimbriimonadaceae bacterium]|nr:DnaB-like helicase C-terminal domain-containing protein [Fimbriimonadaceae bacterium]